MKAIFAMCLLQDLFYYIAQIFSLYSVSFTVFYYFVFQIANDLSKNYMRNHFYIHKMDSYKLSDQLFTFHAK